MSSSLYLLMIITLCLSVLKTDCYSQGAPQAQCEYMTPKHGFQPQISKPNVHIALSRSNKRRKNVNCVKRGQKVVVTMKAEYGQFRGFMLRAEDAQSTDKRGIGTFWLNDTSFGSATQYLHCHGSYQNALTHSGWVFSRNTVIAEWQPPENFTGNVKFRATVVQDYKTYWKDILSPNLKVVNDEENLSNKLDLSGKSHNEELDRRPRQQIQKSKANAEIRKEIDEESQDENRLNEKREIRLGNLLPSLPIDKNNAKDIRCGSLWAISLIALNIYCKVA